MPYIGDPEYNKLRADLETWRDEAEAAYKREAKLVAEIQSIQGKNNRLQDQIERLELVEDARKGE